MEIEMPRRNGRKTFGEVRNKGNHQRRRTTRGHRMISKFVKYKYYDQKENQYARTWNDAQLS